MAITYYVSKSAANGWAVGVDTNSGLTTSLPFLTLEKALTVMVATDICIVNDGTYTHASTFWAFSNSNQTIKPLNDYQVTLKPAAGQGTAFLQNNGGTACTLGAFKVDASGMGANASVVYATSAIKWGDEALGINGPWVINTGAANTGAAFWFGGNTQTATGYNIRVDNGFGKGGVYAPNITTGSVDINGLSGAITNVVTDRCGAFYAKGNTSNAGWVRVRNCSASVAASAASTPCVLGASNIRYIFENNYGMAISGTATTASIVVASPVGVVQADNSICRYNSGVNSAAGHYLYLHGTDGASANDNFQNYPICHDNDFSYTGSDALPHGFLFGSMKGGAMVNNTATGVAIPFISKLQTERSYIGCNKVVNQKNFSATLLYGKGTTGTIFFSNRITLDSINHALCMGSFNDGAGTNSAGVIFSGNMITASSTYQPNLIAAIGSATDTSTGTMIGNSYYIPAGVNTGGAPFVNGATTYAASTAIADWGAAVETNYETRATAKIYQSKRSDIGWASGGIEGTLIAQRGRL